MKKTLSITLLFVAVLFGCKKNKIQQPEFNINGSWVIVSSNVNTQNYLASQYPCMSNSHAIFKSASSAIFKWNGTEHCWLNDAHTIEFNQPGPDSTAATYTHSGNTIKITFPQAIRPEYGQITSINNKLQLSLTDTEYYNNQTITTGAVYLKE